jgi:succinylarginine dihydrolase
VIDGIVSGDNPVSGCEFVSVNQSMRNGGGPACLRLRVVMSQAQLAGAHQGVFMTDALYAALVDCVTRRYRETLSAQDLRDPKLIEESQAAVTEIRAILGLAEHFVANATPHTPATASPPNRPSATPVSPPPPLARPSTS